MQSSLMLQSQLSLAPSLLMLEVNPRIQKWDPDQDITKGLQLIGQWQFAVHVGPGPMAYDTKQEERKKGHQNQPFRQTMNTNIGSFML